MRVYIPGFVYRLTPLSTAYKADLRALVLCQLTLLDRVALIFDMASRPNKWPQASNELLPNTLFRLASQYPSAVYAEFPLTENAADGYRTINFKEVANAVHATAWWIDQQVGKPAKDDGSETLVYMGPNDLRYELLVLGSVMVGYKMLFPNPRYGVEAISTLTSLANGSVMLTPTEPFPVVKAVSNKCSMRNVEVPSVDHFLASTSDSYPYTKTFEASRNEPLICLHTSGTSGFPKPIIWTHDWANSVAKGCYLPAPAGYKLADEDMHGSHKRIMSLFPRMHASGIIVGLILPLYLGLMAIYAPSRLAPDEAVKAAASAAEALGSEDKIDTLALPPPHAEYIGAEPSMLEKFEKLVSTIGWGGGGISNATANALAAKVSVYNAFASTEMGLFPTIRKSEPENNQTVHDEWQYITFHPALNIRFDAISNGDDGTLYQAIVVKNEGELAWIQPIFKIFTDVKEIGMGDMFVRHPHDPNKWKYAGRTDDMLTFLIGGKFYPGAAERQITAHPGVLGAMIVGTRRPRASLILHLKDGTDLESVWEVIEKANQNAPMYARIARHMIVTTTQPFPRTGKGTVQRAGTLKMFADQIEALYKKDHSFA
ncbi:hypothetical protein OPT61_g5072 [Boeremia exigua]|uniref:Uncharacterized protein n=1 Tax=Boeremia exigua TaxID=749465 RepID=A0ACC2IBU8_9PLEO|nr:hypothetical protein OPT61_g5072 [Boeremia exigua]